MSDELKMDKLPPPPAANLQGLIDMFASQSLASMGKMPGAPAGELRLDYAKYFIELLEVLQTKTVGNLSDEETKNLKQVVSQLQMMYVQAKK